MRTEATTDAACSGHQFQVNGVCSECGARNDLPTLPLRFRQTPGGYKAIYDAEDRLVAFLGMRDGDRMWAEFLVDSVNGYAADTKGEALSQTWQLHKNSKLAGAGNMKECTSAAPTVRIIDSRRNWLPATRMAISRTRGRRTV